MVFFQHAQTAGVCWLDEPVPPLHDYGIHALQASSMQAASLLLQSCVALAFTVQHESQSKASRMQRARVWAMQWWCWVAAVIQGSWQRPCGPQATWTMLWLYQPLVLKSVPACWPPTSLPEEHSVMQQASRCWLLCHSSGLQGMPYLTLSFLHSCCATPIACLGHNIVH